MHDRRPTRRSFAPAWTDALAVAIGGLAVIGCYDCTIQGRFMEFRAAGSAGSAVTEVFLDLNETRGSEDAQYVIWSVRVSPLDGPVTAVRLRVGTAEAPGAVLYDFPLVNAVPDAGVITQVFVNQPYAGEVPFDELWDLIQGDPVFVEVIYQDSPAVPRIGPLELTNARDWQDILCS
jgi:hypothetical protein